MNIWRALMRGSLHMIKSLAYDFGRLHVAKWIALKPVVINLLANDICNSRCSMCMVWKNKRDREISAAELRRILIDSLFNRVQHVGVSGGEPTLRDDLPDLFEAICKSLPRLTSTSLITNAVQPQTVVDRITESAEVCRSHGISFQVMVSLDGVGEVHDRNRGRAGNFQSALHVVRHFRDNTPIPISVGCTITRLNVWDVDQLLEFCQSERIRARFRVAEYIDRLNNDEQTDVIRNFSPIERYHLALFFTRLELTYEKSEKVCRTYRNIKGMLLGEHDRRIGCPYQSRGVVLGCRGEISYCAPKSRILGSALESSASRVFAAGLHERRRILREDCWNCIHDYHAPVTSAEQWSAVQEKTWRRLLNLDRAIAASHRMIH